MSAVIYKYVCALCGTEFEASGAPEMSYGELVLRSESGEEAYLEAVSNPAFNEVLNIVRRHLFLAKADQAKSGLIAQKVFGLACDPSPSGLRLYVEMMPPCPSCFSREMASWGEIHPQKLSQIPLATQARWASMSDNDKFEVINEAVRMLS